MNVQSLSIENPAISPMHVTGRHVLLAVTLVIVTFSMLLCLCIFFAYNAPLLFMTHLFSSITSLPATSISALTFCITGGTAIILWIALFLCARQERVTRTNKDIPLSLAFFSASSNPLFSSTSPASAAPIASIAPMQQRTEELFFSQPTASTLPTSHYGKQATWEASFVREIEDKQHAVRMRQHAREMRLQTYASGTGSKGHKYQMQRAGTRNFYKKTQQNSALNKHTSGEKPGAFDEIYWWSTMSSEQEQGLRSTEGMEKIMVGNGGQSKMENERRGKPAATATARHFVSRA